MLPTETETESNDLRAILSTPGLVMDDAPFSQRRLLQEALNQANIGVDLDEILDRIYQAFRPLIPYDRLSLALLERRGAVVRCRWARSESPEIRLRPGFEEPVTETSLGSMIREARPRILNDLAAHLTAHPRSRSTRYLVEEGMRSSLTCPLIAMGSPIGFLFFSSAHPGTYRDIHIDAFLQITDQIAVILEKGRLFEQLQLANLRLHQEIGRRQRTEGLLLRAQKELETANRELDQLASIDGLTGVANRRSFDAALRREWERARATGRPISLVLADVDHFKAYNDAHGHVAGDACLRTIARALRGSSRGNRTDLAARYGGEEFAVLLPGAAGSNAVMIAERLRHAVADLAIPHGNSPAGPVMTISVGVATQNEAACPDDGPDRLVAEADRALYEAKAAGRNRVVRA